MKARHLFSAMTIWLHLVTMSVTAEAGEIEWARFNLAGDNPERGHISRQMTVRVTESSQSLTGTAMNIDLWRGECGVRIRLGRDTASVSVTDACVKVDSKATSHKIYPVPGGLEWEVTLASRPRANGLSFGIELDDLVFYRQDSLSDLEKNLFGAHRPDSVIGAWVAYHSTRTHNRRSITGNDTCYYDYGTGQAFVIYRPRAWDGNDTVWCELSIDAQLGRLSITIDGEWLDSAQYPVTIDPTFGNTAIGASTLSWNQFFAYCHSLAGTNTYSVPRNVQATITGFSVYGCETGAGDMSVNMAAFDIDDGSPGIRVDQPAALTVSGGTPDWFSSPAVSQTLTPLTEYGVAIGCAPRSGGTIYYNTITGAAPTDNANCDLSSTEWTLATVTDFNFSMYATITEEEIASATSGRRRRVLETAAIEGRER